MAQRKSKDWLLVAFFPVTAYMFVGSTLFFILHKFEGITERLGRYSQTEMFAEFEAPAWHNENVWLTVFFPITWPCLVFWAIGLFVVALILAILRLIYNIIDTIRIAIVNWLTAVWNSFVELLTYIWEETKDIFS